MLSPDYAQFEIENGTLIPGPRMQRKMKAIPFPDFKGATVLDVGCDYGQFSFYAASQGSKVTGLDRNRDVKGQGFTDLISLNNKNASLNNLDCSFHKINIGKQWHEFGKHDIVLVMSVYHHLYENCGDHKAVWYWLWRHCNQVLIYEGPLDDQDQVVQMNVSKPFVKSEILDAASLYFDVEFVGPALHEPHRVVYKFYPKTILVDEYILSLHEGTKGATKAFEYLDGRRISEIEDILGYRPYPGSLNCTVDRPFDYSKNYYTASILDLKNRSTGLDGEWALREARFIPVIVIGDEIVDAHAFKFKGDSYAPEFIELISPVRLRDINPVQICVK